MKKSIRRFIVLLIHMVLCAALTSRYALAYVNCSFSDYTFVLDGKNAAVNAAILNSAEMIGIMSFCDAAGIDYETVSYGNVNVFLGDRVLQFSHDSDEYTVDGQTGYMSAPALMTDRDLYVGFEVLSDVFEMNTQWNHLKFTVNAESEGAYMNALKIIRNGSDYVDERITVAASDAAYVCGGDNASKNYSQETQLIIKNFPNNKSYDRTMYLKFDISGVAASSAETAYISIKKDFYEGNESYYPIRAYSTDSDWSGNIITYDSAPGTKNDLGETIIGPNNTRYKIDITDYADAALKSGADIVSVAVRDESGYGTRIANSAGNAPKLVIIPSGGKPIGNIFVNENFDEYSSRVNYKNSDDDKYSSAPTRTIESLCGYTVGAADSLDLYGGLNGTQYDATGYFYTKRINGRWYIIDPLGHQFFSSGVNCVMTGTTPRQKNSLVSKYGTYENWGREVSDFLKNDLKFNTAGAWSSYKYLDGAENKLSYTPMIECAAGYAASVGQAVEAVGHTAYKYNNCMPIFDPGFETYVDETVRSGTLQRRDDSNIIGWLSDNELPVNSDMLDRYLSLDNTINANKYSYEAAWEWFRRAVGKRDAALSDITKELREEWRRFVYDRYFGVVSKSFKKYAPNHMYMGCRFMVGGYDSEGMMSAAGKFCDIVTVNYYFSWNPEISLMFDWAQWTDKPFIVTEAYAMSADSGLDCYGGGWVVPTQADRGLFYQNYALRLLETKNCVGYHWFKFMDNDYTDKPGINKGIVDSDFNVYNALANDMRIINSHKYSLIEHFDGR